MRGRRLLAVLVIGGAASALAAQAAEPADVVPGYAIDTVTSAGYRMVDIDGAKDKYREDYNLRSGGRLFALDVRGVAKAPDDTRLDRFHLEIDTPGDEPVSHFRLSAADRTLYDLRADFTRSKYVYDVPQLFEESVAGVARLDDLHDFDVVRTDGRVDLTLRPPRLPTFRLGYRLHRRDGDAISSLYLLGGDTFLVRAPVDSVTHVGSLGTEFRAAGTDVFLQQEYQWTERRNDRDAVLMPRGLDPADASTLRGLARDQRERLDVPVTTVRLRRPFGDAVEVTGAYLYSRADLDVDAAERRTGATTAAGLPVAGAIRGAGAAALDTHVADLGSAIRLAEWVRVQASYRFDERRRDGRLDEVSGAGRLALATGDAVRTHRVTTSLQIDPRDDLALDVGVRWGRRAARFSVSNQDITTDTLGALAGVRYRPWSLLDVFARYEHARIDDPFTVPADALGAPPLPEREIALTFTNRATAGFRLTPAEWMALRYELVADSRENDTFAARSRAFGNTVSLTVTPRAGLTLFASYTRRDIGSEADVRLAPLYARARSVQNGSEDVFVSELRWDFRLHDLDWWAGWNVAYVSSEATLLPRLEPGLAGRTFFDLSRVDGGVVFGLRHPFIEPAIELRLIDYDERVLPRNDYRATMLTFSLTKRLSF